MAANLNPGRKLRAVKGKVIVKRGWLTLLKKKEHGISILRDTQSKVFAEERKRRKTRGGNTGLSSSQGRRFEKRGTT